MSNMNELGFPMWDHLRMDGRYLKTVQCIDFLGSSLGGETSLTMTINDRDEPLLPGTIFGSIIRYRWRQREWETCNGNRRVSNPSTRLHLQGYYTGQSVETPITVPGFKTKEPVMLPVVDLKLWRWSQPYKIDVGQIALARLCEGERAVIQEINFDHQAIMRDQKIEPRTDNPHPYLSTVQFGGLYVVPLAPG